MKQLSIADLKIALHRPTHALAELHDVCGAFQERADAYAQSRANPHLCHAGCSQCCKSGAFFAVSLVEALQLAVGLAEMPNEHRGRIRESAKRLLDLQSRRFGETNDPPDVPGLRDEGVFTARVARVNRSDHPTCPLLSDDLCSIYAHRPFLCRAYGYPVDAFAVETPGEIVFRSLCHLYEGMALREYVRARDLHARLATISWDLAGGRDVGRFTAAEAILATTT